MLLDDIAYGVRWLTAFATGRGATALAVTGAAVGMAYGGVWLPLIGLALGVPVTAALATMSHHHQQQQLRAHYREEIAATLGIEPRQVTMEHLRAVANGIPERQIPGNRTLHEALERNDRGRSISVVANIVSAAIAAGVVAALHSLVGPTALVEGLQKILPLGASNLSEAMALGGVAAVTSFGLDQAFGVAGRRMFGYQQPSLNDRIERISNSVRRGQGIGVAQMMALVEEANPGVQREIKARFGLAFRQLPAEQQNDVIAHYDQEFQLKATTEAINHGLMPAQELAFAIEGRRSGMLPPAASLVQAYHAEVQKAKAEGIAIPERQPQAGLMQRVPGLAQAQRFVDRVRGHAPAPAGLTHVQRLEQQAAQHADASKAIH
jgi:hypothetical protein